MKFAKRLLQAMRGGAPVIRAASVGESREDLEFRQKAMLAAMGSRALCPTRGPSAVPLPRYVTPTTPVGATPERPLPVLVGHDLTLELTAEQVQELARGLPMSVGYSLPEAPKRHRHLRVVE